MSDPASTASQRLQQAECRLQAATEELRLAEAIFDTVQAVMVTDRHGVILRVNPAFCHLTGYSGKEVVGKTPWLLRSGHHDEDFYRTMRATVAQHGRWQGEIWDRHKNGSVFPKWMTITVVMAVDGEVHYMVATYVDISERKRAEAEIHRLAFYDLLTGLPNRNLLLDRLQQAMSAAAHGCRHGAVLLIDLDEFRHINESLGYREGDRLLQLAGQRLQQVAGDEDSIARIGGDEFIVLYADVGASQAQAACRAEHAAKAVLALLGEAYELEGGAYRCTASIGLALFAGETIGGEELLKQAELAMYQAKAEGRDRFHFFVTELEDASRERLELQRELGEAVCGQQLVLHLQPQVTAEGAVWGAEALLRWQHPGRGLLGPAQFIAVAEDSGQIVAIGGWVLEQACAQLAVWADKEHSAHLQLAVNVSALQFAADGFVDDVEQLLRVSGANPARLKLELTESVLVDEAEVVIGKMQALKKLGLQLSLDDFGTGYSSLAYLQQMPLDQLKIDQSFVRDVVDDASALAIARSITALGHNLGLLVIAEGVENPAQRAQLVSLGCDVLQGYCISPPLDEAAFELWLQRRRQAD